LKDRFIHTDFEVAAPIVVLAAMESEFTELCDALEGAQTKRVGSHEFVEGCLDGQPVVIGRTLIGIVNAASATTEAIMAFSPQCIIIQGTAGADNPALMPGTIVLGERIVYLGRYTPARRLAGEGISFEGRTYYPTEVLIDGEVAERDVFYGDERLLDIARRVPYALGDVVCGTVGASDVWNKEIDLMNHYHELTGVDCEDMESFAVAQVCAACDVPMLSVRIVSNNVFHPEMSFDESWASVCQQFTLDIVRAIGA